MRVLIKNTGTRTADPFVVEVNGVRKNATSLAPGQTLSLWFSGYNYNGNQTAVVDAASQIEESEEGNNGLSQLLPIPTPPPICTPTPTVTPTSQPGVALPPAATATPTATWTPAPTFTPTPTATVQPVIVPPPTPTPTPAPLFLTIQQPADGSVVETSNLTILGKTLPSAVVSINGNVVDVDAGGNFSLQVTLDVGPNVFEAIATDADGAEATAQLTIYFAP